MGITASAPTNPNGDLNEQLSKLGDRNPFGNDEIIRLARVYTFLNTSPVDSRKDLLTDRFLVDLATFSSTLRKPILSKRSDENSYVDLLQVDQNMFMKPSPQILKRRERIKFIMSIIDEKVLPENFGRTIQESFFTLLKPVKFDGEYDLSPDVVEVKIGWTKLAKFIDGASETSRRGSRKAMECVFKCCALDNDSNRANAKKLMDCFYRIALACAIYDTYMTNQRMIEDQKERIRLKEIERKKQEEEKQRLIATGQYNPDDDDEEDLSDEETIIPPFDPSSMYPSDIGDTLAASLLEHAQKISLNMGMGSLNISDSSKGDTNDTISLDIFLAWADSNAPCLGSCLETFVHLMLFPDKPYPPSRSEFIFPRLEGQQSAFFNSDQSPLLFNFATMSPSLCGAWHRLYTTDSDGLSFNRLQNALAGYSGPTLLIVREADQGGVFGAFSSTAWKESKNFYGNSDCFLFSISPSLKLMRPRGAGTNYQYCNPESRSRGYDGQAHGIGFGGDCNQPRLFISETFDENRASASDLTFEAGRLLPPREGLSKLFDLESLEVWGVGGDEVVAEALVGRKKQREIVASNIQKARKVDKAQFLDDFKSGLIESKAFKHRAEMRGRGDCHVDENDDNNYVYEK